MSTADIVHSENVINQNMLQLSTESSIHGWWSATACFIAGEDEQTLLVSEIVSLSITHDRTRSSRF
jgi:hypothetical protein